MSSATECQTTIVLIHMFEVNQYAAIFDATSQNRVKIEKKYPRQ